MPCPYDDWANFDNHIYSKFAKVVCSDTPGGWLLAGRHGRRRERGGEIVLFTETAIDAACYAGGERPFDQGAAAADEDGESDARVKLVGVGEEPADVGRL